MLPCSTRPTTNAAKPVDARPLTVLGLAPMLRPFALTLAASLTFSICAGANARPAPALSSSAKRGLAFAQQHCAVCHGVIRNSSSPNPESPPFEEIANREGLTGMTLRQFLQDSHNYPEAMNFKVERRRIRDLADYVVTLKRPGYKPVM